MSQLEDYIDEPMLDIDVVVDHSRKVYQIQLYSTPYPDLTVPYIVAVLPPQHLERLLYRLRDLANQGYLPIWDEPLPSDTEKVLEEWR